MHKYESKSRITVNSVMIETFYTVHALQRMTLWCCLYWGNITDSIESAASLMTDWMLIRGIIVFKTWLRKKHHKMWPLISVIPAWHFNALITRKCTMNSTLEILNKSFSWINRNKYQSLIHISLSFQLTKCWAQSFAIGVRKKNSEIRNTF